MTMAPPIEFQPLISVAQPAPVADFIESASAANHLEVVPGGAAAGGTRYYFKPTVLAGALQVHEILQLEVFGPVVSMTQVQ